MWLCSPLYRSDPAVPFLDIHTTPRQLGRSFTRQEGNFCNIAHPLLIRDGQEESDPTRNGRELGLDL